MYYVRKSLAVARQCVVTFKLHLTVDGYILLFNVFRTATDIYLIVWLQHKRALSLWDGEVGVEAEAVCECQSVACLCGVWVDDSS